MTIIGSSPPSALGKVVVRHQEEVAGLAGTSSPPYLDPATSVLDAVIERAKSDGVDLVMVWGNPRQRIPS
jgi:hypothetical protein